MKRELLSFGRISAKKQEAGNSMQRQRDAYNTVCERYKDRGEPSQRYGFGTFFGHGESGFHGRHIKEGGSLRALLDKLDAREIEPEKCALVIEAFDRLGRLAPDLAMRLLSDIVRSGCPVVVANPDLWLDASELEGPKFIMISAYVQMAHAESKQKSDRLRKSWAARRAKRREKPVTTVCPDWLKPVDGGFTFIDERRAVVQRIFQLYIDGLGYKAIAFLFNREKVPTFSGKPGQVWSNFIVRRIIESRTTMGEFQPQELKPIDGKLKKVRSGDAVADYYPAAVNPETYHRAQGCRVQRRSLKGRPSKHIYNLFKGLIFDARTKSPMTIESHTRGGKEYTYLVPEASIRSGAPWQSIRYDLAEMGFLWFVEELKVGSEAPNSNQAEIAKEEALIAKLSADLEALNAEEDLEVLLPLVRAKTAAKRAAQARLQKLQRTTHGKTAVESLDDLQTFTRLYDEHKAAGTLDTFKETLRNKIRSLVAEMWCLIVEQNQMSKTAVFQVFLRSGERRWFTVQSRGRGKTELGPDPAPHVDPTCDLRLWKP